MFMILPSKFTWLMSHWQKLAFVLLGFSILNVSNAQEGQKVTAIDVQYVGSKTVNDSLILSKMSTKVGDNLSIAQIDEDVKNLHRSGKVDNVRILSESRNGGVALIVVVQSTALYGGTKFEGNTIFSDSKLAKKVGLSVNKAIDESAIRKARQEIQEMYRKDGYPETTVSYRIGAPSKEGYSVVAFVINEGSQGVLNQVSFVGNQNVTKADLLGVMSQKEKSIKNLVGGGGRTDGESLANDVRAIEDLYRDRGYLNARVSNVSKVPVDAKYNDVVISVEEGSIYKVAGVKIDGVKGLSMDGDIMPYMKSHAGSPFSGSNLRNDIKLISDKYGTKGYTQARVSPRLVEAAGPNQVMIELDVEEGPAFNIGKIHIEGNTKTKDSVIRRELPLIPGDPLNSTVMDITQRRLLNLGYFEQVDVRPVNTNYIDEQDLVIRVSEKPTGSLNFGAGFSSIDNVTGFLEITQSNFDLFDWPNFIGGGQRFRLSLRGGAERKDFSLSITEPWAFGRRLSLTGEAYYRDLQFLSDEFEQTNYGGAISARTAWGRYGSLSFGYRWETIEIDPETDASPIIAQDGGEHVKSSVFFDYTFDNRDDFFTPRKGQKVSLSLEQAGLGGTIDETIASASASHHFTVPGTDLIFNFLGRYRYSSEGEFTFTRYYLGGPNNLRGFDFREAGPRDPTTNEPVGGARAWDATVEATYPIADKIRLAGFYDVGEVTDAPTGAVGGGLHSSAGIGARLFFMGPSPIRLDYAWPLQSDELSDDGPQFNFTIGTRF